MDIWCETRIFSLIKKNRQMEWLLSYDIFFLILSLLHKFIVLISLNSIESLYKYSPDLLICLANLSILNIYKIVSNNFNYRQFVFRNPEY